MISKIPTVLIKNRITNQSMSFLRPAFQSARPFQTIVQATSTIKTNLFPIGKPENANTSMTLVYFGAGLRARYKPFIPNNESC